MKKFLLCLFSFLFIGTALAGSCFLLAGCDSSYSQEENGENSEGNLGNNEENADTPSEDDMEMPNQGGTSEENNDNDETNELATEQDFYIRAQFRTSYTAVTVASSSTSSPTAQAFTATIYNESGSKVDWGDSVTFSSGASTSNASSGTVYTSYVHGDYSSSGIFSKTYKRYVEITPRSFSGSGQTGYTFFGFSTSLSWSNGSNTEVPSNKTIYAYNSTYSTSKPSSSSVSSTTKFNIYLLFRQYWTLYYHYWEMPGTYSAERLGYQVYAGVGINTNTTTTDNVGDDYELIGWSTSQNDSVPDFKLGSALTPSPSLANSSGVINLYGVYAPKVKIYAYYTSNYSSFTNGNIGGTISISYTNTSGSTSSAYSIYSATYNVAYNKSLTLTATAKSGYQFAGWYDEKPDTSNRGTAINENTSYSFSPTTEATYERYALFVLYRDGSVSNAYTNDYSSINVGNTGGSVRVNYHNIFDELIDLAVNTTSQYRSVYGLNVTVKATAKSGYNFVGWYSAKPSTENNNNFVSSLSEYSFTPGAFAEVVYGLFAKTYTLTVKYASGDYTHSTTITAKNTTIGLNQTISSGNSYTLTTYCRQSSQTITISRVNTAYTYYIGNGSVSTSSSTNSFTYIWSTIANETINVYVRERYTITYNANGGSGIMPSGVTAPMDDVVYKAHGLNIIIGDNTLSKTGYTANGWNTSSAGTGTHYNNGVSYTNNANATLYAQFDINTYTLTIKYYKFAGVSGNSTNLNISAPSGNTLSSSQISVNASATVKHTYTTTAQTITLARSNSGASFYIDIDKTPTMSSSVNSKTYSWIPTSNATINVYIYRRYTITYNGNDNTGGTVPNSQYKIHGTAITLASNNLTRTGHTANGWNTNSAGNGTHYNNGESYNAEGSVTIYAQWTVNQYSIRIYAMTGIQDIQKPNTTWTDNYKEVKVDYGTSYTLTVTMKDGFRFDRWTTTNSSTATAVGTSATYTFTVGAQNYTFYAWGTPNNPAKYDTAGGYYYVEIGNMPQTKVTDSNLISQINSSTTNGATYYINGTTMVSKKVNNVEYCKYGNNWYKVEPIRWRLAYSSSQKSGYGTTTDTFAVLDTIVYAGQYSATEIGLNSGYVTTTLDEFKKNITSTTYLATFSANVESFSPTGTTSSSQSANMFIAYADEISSVLNNKTGLSKYSVKFSDLVSDILGNGIYKYYTRDLGSNTSEIEVYTELGMKTQSLCTNVLGAQFTIKVSEYGCV